MDTGRYQAAASLLDYQDSAAVNQGRDTVTEYNITPIPKPRQTRRDKWLNPPRPSVARYRAFANECKRLRVEVPAEGANIAFIMPMPKSWSKKKKEEMDRQPHTQRPDLSNLLKSLEDAVYGEDSHIWHYKTVMKIWGRKGKIIIG
jgi:Holliday junction resolvase RusA-like endonuclease